MTHDQRIAEARQRKLCMACAFYGDTNRLSSRCTAGAPDWAYRGDNGMMWSNSCQRFVAQQVAA